MANKIAGCWIVGSVDWRDGVARVTIARTKTRARQLAELQLARAQYDWAKHPPKARATCDEARIRHCAKASGPGSVIYRQAVKLLDGIPLNGPDGEHLVIREPSQSARRKVARSERETDAMVAAMASAISRISVRPA